MLLNVLKLYLNKELVLGVYIIYHTIAEQIIDSIITKKFTTKLPTEAQLMELYGVSRNTIRRAIGVVFQRGLLKRVQGSGYFINDITRDGKLVVNLSMGAGEPVRDQDTGFKSKVLSFREITVDEEFSKESKIPVGEKVYRIIRLRFLKEKIYCLETAHYLKSVVPYIPRDAAKKSLFKFIKEAYDLDITNSENYTSVTCLDETQAKNLEKKVGSQELTLTQYSYCRNNVLMNYTYTIYVYPNLNFYFTSTRNNES